MDAEATCQVDGQGLGHARLSAPGVRPGIFLGEDGLRAAVAHERGEFRQRLATAEDEPAAPDAQFGAQLAQALKQESNPL